MDDNQEVMKRWDEYADEMGKAYTSEGDLNRVYLLNPEILRLVGDIKGKNVLDAGCGEGYLSRLLHGKGAIVTSFDFSSKMVDVALQKTMDSDIKIFQADFQNLNTINDSCFDIVISNMVIHDLPDHKKAISEAYRVLKDGGVFVFSILHPCFDTPGSRWIKDDEGNKLFWKVTRYFEQGKFEQPSAAGSSHQLIFHRTLSNYFNTLRQCGFVVEEMSEPEPDAAAIEAHSDFINFKNMCHFLIFKATKF